MAFQVIPQSSFGSNVGSAIGRGLSEQLPKEMQRGQLAAGLKQLGGTQEQLSPLELSTRALSIPGMTPELLQQFLPLIQQAQARRALEQRAKGIGQAAASTAPAAEGISNQPKIGGFLERTRQRGFGIAPSPESVDSEAADLLKNGAYFDPEAARNAALQRQQMQYNQDQTIKATQQETLSLIENAIKSKGVDVTGELKDRLAQEVNNNILDKGMSQQEASQDLSKKLLELSKSQVLLKELGSGFQAKRKQAVQESVDAVRNEYKKLNALDQFEQDLQSYLAYSPELASQFAYPKEKVSAINRIVHELKPTGIPKGQIGPIAFGMARKPVPEKIVQEILDNWSPDIGIKGLARDFELKGYSGQSLMNQLKPYIGTDKFTSRQEREFQSPLSTRSALGDLWLQFVETRKKV